jgi:glycosyltransferase involved in cell wall biosynthesis
VITRSTARLTPDFEVIIVNDGSADATAEIADELAHTYPEVKVVHHPRNRGYGGALRSGFQAATRDLVFYTDGDAQHPGELSELWSRMTPDADLVNGYKISRSDPLHRIIIGRIYHHVVSTLFGLTVRDVDCDFRLMRRSIFERVQLEKTSGVICLEMMKKISVMPGSGSSRSRSITTIGRSASPSSSTDAASSRPRSTSCVSGSRW